MKVFLTILILTCYLSSAQQLKFNGISVDSIFFKSHASAYQFDNKGTTTGKESYQLIVYDALRNAYFVDKCSSTSYVATYKPSNVDVKKKDLKDKIPKKVNSENLQLLFNSLNTPLRSKDLIHQVDTAAFYDYVTTKQIMKEARRCEVAWMFKKRYGPPENQQTFFRTCQSLDTLEIFLNEEFETKGYAMVTDVASTINIKITTSDSAYRFEAKYPNTYKQPWYDHSDTGDVFPSAVLNFDIHNALVEILPTDFLLINSLKVERLFDAYIRWYFVRRGMLY